MRSSPVRTLSPPRMHEWVNLEICQDRRGLVEAERRRVIALEIHRHGVADVILQLLERPGLGNDRRVDALGGVDVIVVRNVELKDRFHKAV